MSIHPQYADAILRGEKTVEFRKQPIAGDVTHVIVYATAPVGAVVGAFTVTAQHTDTPSGLWRRFASGAGISRRRFFEYYAARTQGTGIEVGEVFTATQPLDLSNALGVPRPPQSYQYLCSHTANEALRAMTPVRGPRTTDHEPRVAVVAR